MSFSVSVHNFFMFILIFVHLPTLVYFVQGLDEVCINEAIEDTTAVVLKQHPSDEPEDVVVVLEGIKGRVHPKMKILSL